jgi:hypothetical protein
MILRPLFWTMIVLAWLTVPLILNSLWDSQTAQWLTWTLFIR